MLLFEFEGFVVTTALWIGCFACADEDLLAFVGIGVTGEGLPLLFCLLACGVMGVAGEGLPC